MKKILILLIITVFLQQNTFAGEDNNLRTKFLNNKTNICCINIRTFNAKDINGNEIIDENEESGNFINAVERLDELKQLGIDTLHVMPITPVGKLKALGTAGSVYAISSFSDVNPQLADKNSNLSPKDQAKYFIEECHKRGIKVIVDLPSCGAYDLFITNPELFIKDDKKCSVVPSDWTDVRLLNTGDNKKLNKDVYNAHVRFVDMLMYIGADGIRADVATIKPSLFWKDLINYTHTKDQEFMFLAEASDSWREPPSPYAQFTPYNELLEAGFDGYYGSFFNLKEWNSQQLIEHILFNKKLLNNYSTPKSVIMSFTTHDEVSPFLLHGEQFSIMIAWLEATLPFNTYIIDGFQTGDSYIYQWANTKAKITETDDDYYFVHRGKLDIFNFSRKPQGNNKKIYDNLQQAYKFRNENLELITKGEFIPIKTKDEKVFAYIRVYNNETFIILGNLDFDNEKKNIVIKSNHFKKKTTYSFVHTDSENIKISRGKCKLDLKQGEIKLIKLN